MVPIQHGINNRALVRDGVEDQITDSIGRLIEKRADAEIGHGMSFLKQKLI
jgi:hypothetical protein